MKYLCFNFAVLLCTMLFISVDVVGQKYEFEIFMTGSKIGTLIAERKVKGDIEMYTITSTANAKILWKEINSVSTNRTMFKGGFLSESYYEYKENDVVDKYCKTNPATVGYNIHHWKKGKYTLGTPAKLSIVQIYFVEPQGGAQYYDESWGEMVTMKKTADHQYEYKAKEGDKNVYRYANGKIIEAEFHTTIVTVKMRPKA